MRLAANRSFLSLALLAAFLSPSIVGAAETPAHPNILFIVSDELTFRKAMPDIRSLSELYDHSAADSEHHNLCDKPEHAGLRKELFRLLQKGFLSK